MTDSERAYPSARGINVNFNCGISKCRLVATPVVVAGLAAWAAAILAGLVTVSAASMRPGAGAAIASDSHWPEGSDLKRNVDGPTLVMTIHPRCPCTGASLAELDRVLRESTRVIRTYLLVRTPAVHDATWTETAQTRAARSIAGAIVLDDPSGADAARFGALTSGQVLLYDRDGRLQFSGGVTGARGHAGPNVGSDALAAHLAGAEGGPSQAEVFGCALFIADDCDANGCNGSPEAPR